MTETTSQGPARRVAVTVRDLRLWSGLILFGFAATHFLNLVLGFVSLEVMETARLVRVAVTRSLPGTVILAGAVVLHAGLGLAAFLRRRPAAIRAVDAVQLAFGLLIPLWLMRHVIDTRLAHEWFGLRDNYGYALWGLWPNEAVNQAILMLLVWVHGCIGLHHWLAGRAWYRRWLWALYGAAILMPPLAYAGFATAARAHKTAGGIRNPFAPGQYDVLVATMAGAERGWYLVLAAALAQWLGLLLRLRLRSHVTLRYAGGPVVRAPRGLTVLEISRMNRIPHAAVCGGRARCSTCRIRVTEGLGDQPPPSGTEAQVLQRVGAPANVRLACQLRPTGPLTLSTLLPAQVVPGPGDMADRYLWGVEREVTLLFADLRGFTAMSEGRLPFDTVFLLNQFLGRMAEAIEDSGGFVDKFMGDGIMAIFGMEGDGQAGVQAGARQAIAAARGMGGVLAALNASLRDELPAPLAMGIGLHTGPAILGRIGAAGQSGAVARITALGETVNLASRLESLTKELAVEVVASAACLAAAGLEPGGGARACEVEVRGISKKISVWSVFRATDLPEAGDAAGMVGQAAES